MLQMQTRLDIADNSGAKSARCIQLLGGGTTSIGKIVVVSITSVLPGSSSKVKKGQVVRGIVVRTRASIQRADGSEIKFDDNAIVLIDSLKEPIGTRIFGPVARELRAKGFLKIVSLASEVL